MLFLIMFFLKFLSSLFQEMILSPPCPKITFCSSRNCKYMEFKLVFDFEICLKIQQCVLKHKKEAKHCGWPPFIYICHVLK